MVDSIRGTIGSNNFENSQFYLIMQKKAINTYDHCFIFILTKKKDLTSKIKTKSV
jgi:hypothetical protein